MLILKVKYTYVEIAFINEAIKKLLYNIGAKKI